MKNSLVIVIVMFICIGNLLGQDTPISTNNTSTVAYTIEEQDLFPEGIAYDSKTRQLFLSSISKEKVVVVDESGHTTDFISPKQDGMLRSLGMKVDVERRRLWVVSNSDWGENVISAVHIYDIDSKKLIKSIFTDRSKVPTFNDLILTNSGGAFISDWRGNSIYQVPSDLSKVELFHKSDSLLVGANGLELNSDESFLYVASHTMGIVRIDLKSKSTQLVVNNSQIHCKSIDGLMFYKNSLIGIFNGDDDLTKHFIARYQLSEDGLEIISASIIDENNPLFRTPTTGFVSNDELYCLAATDLHLFTMDGDIDTTQLKNPVVLKYILD